MEQFEVQQDPVTLDKYTSALVDVTLAPDNKTLSGVANNVFVAMQSLPFRALALYAQEDSTPGAEELAALVQASSAFIEAQGAVLNALVRVNLHLEGEGLPYVCLGADR